MLSPSRSLVFALALCAAALRTADAQQAITPIEQARLFQRSPQVTNTNVTADGMALPTSDGSGDDSFGDQVILKNQQRARTFFVTGDASYFYTSNVALTRRDTKDDSFFVGHIAGSWTPRLSQNLEAQLAASASFFRYSDASALDFTNLGIGGGLYYSPPTLAGVAFFARYDLVELISRGGDEILQDHEFTLGVQKVVSLGRAHAFTIGATVMAGITEPYAAQRDQAGLFLGYRAQLTRALDTEIFYRSSLHYYNASERFDWNQLVSWNLRYHLTPWAELDAFFSFGTNRSEKSVFDYNVVTTGGGAGLTLRF